MNRRKFIGLAPFLVFVLLVTLFTLPLLQGRDPSLHPSALQDKPVPDFVLPPALDGQPGFATADLKGRVSLVNIFASWCVTCAAEQAFLTDRIAATGIPLYGINYKDKKEEARAWLEKNGNPFTAIGADSDGRVAIDWGVYGVPETYLVDAAGIIRYRHVGPLTPAVWQEFFIPLLPEAGK